MGDAAFLTYSETAGLLSVSASGNWTAGNAGNLETELQQFAAAAGKAKAITVDMAGVAEFDTFGAWLLERFRRELTAAGTTVKIRRMPIQDKALFEEMAGVNKLPAKPVTAFGGFLRWPQAVGVAMAGLAQDLLAFSVMFGASVIALVRVAGRPRSFRLTSTVHQFDRVGWQAVPIILMITFLIGAIIAQQGFFHFRQFGADLYVVDMVGFLVMREIGVLIVAIMVAGRTGSSYTAELGSMKMREEIDALRTMGFDPVEILILPRILVLVVAMPVLTFIGSMAALFGAGLVATFYGGMSAQQFTDRLQDAISFDHFQVGLIKAPFIGAAIGVIACNEGLAVRGSASSLGLQTTKSVVKSIFMVIVLDAMFAVFFSAIGK